MAADSVLPAEVGGVVAEAHVGQKAAQAGNDVCVHAPIRASDAPIEYATSLALEKSYIANASLYRRTDSRLYCAPSPYGVRAPLIKCGSMGFAPVHGGAGAYLSKQGLGLGQQVQALCVPCLVEALGHNA